MYHRSFLLVGLLALCGCYSYAMTPLESATPGERVRARVSAVEAERLSEILGREDRLLEGRVVSTGGGGLLLDVSSAVTTAGTAVQWMNQRVEVTPAALLELEVRRLDPWRTAGAAALVGGAIGFAAVRAFDAVGSGSSEGSKGGSDNFIGITLPLPW